MKYDVQECIDTITPPIWQNHFKGSTTAYLNAVFELQELVCPAQMDLLGAAFMIATAGSAQTHVGTGAGGSHSDLPPGTERKTTVGGDDKFIICL